MAGLLTAIHGKQQSAEAAALHVGSNTLSMLIYTDGL